MSSLVLPMKSVLNFLSLLTEVVIPAHLAVDWVNEESNGEQDVVGIDVDCGSSTEE